MSLVALKAELRQQLKLSPQLLQSMEILQMNSQELLEYLGRLTEENPLLEQEDVSSLRGAYEELRQKASWIDGGVYGATFAMRTAVPRSGGPRTGTWRACPPSSGTSWSAGGCQSRCWPCPNTSPSW